VATEGQKSQEAYEKIPVEVEANSKQTEILEDLVRRYGKFGQP
jgi:hypothetical protein